MLHMHKISNTCVGIFFVFSIWIVLFKDFPFSWNKLWQKIHKKKRDWKFTRYMDGRNY